MRLQRQYYRLYVFSIQACEPCTSQPARESCSTLQRQYYRLYSVYKLVKTSETILQTVFSIQSCEDFRDNITDCIQYIYKLVKTSETILQTVFSIQACEDFRDNITDCIQYTSLWTLYKSTCSWVVLNSSETILQIYWDIQIYRYTEFSIQHLRQNGQWVQWVQWVQWTMHDIWYW